ncbi:MAG: DUF2764 domain-containing protein [Spirochaetia bacterium]|nr:DUF2764 domain-containing protein [Spirochaetia bacterium]
MRSNYYYLYSSLPEIRFEATQDYSRLSYIFDEVYESLCDEDKLLMLYIRYPVDNRNMINLLEKNSTDFSPFGNYSERELRQEIVTLDTLPKYMQLFLEMYREFPVEMSGHGNINRLNPFFYDEVMELGNGLLKQWFLFDRDLKNVLTAIECRKHNQTVEKRDIPRIGQKMGQILIGENDITENLHQSKSLDYSLSGTLPWIAKVLNFNSISTMDYEKKILLLQFEMIDQIVGNEIFSVDTILAFMLKLHILMRWSKLDEHAGRKNFDRIMGQTPSLVENIFLF